MDFLVLIIIHPSPLRFLTWSCHKFPLTLISFIWPIFGLSLSLDQRCWITFMFHLWFSSSIFLASSYSLGLTNTSHCSTLSFLDAASFCLSHYSLSSVKELFYLPADMYIIFYIRFFRLSLQTLAFRNYANWCNVTMTSIFPLIFIFYFLSNN